MATKKNNKSSISHYINLAFEQAQINLGSTGSNPSVGCVVEKNGSILSSGCTSMNGRPHAENVALNRGEYKGANIYITLEPCSHYGLSPPCTKLIIKKKISKVFYSIDDLDKRSANKSKKILKKKKISVNSNINLNAAKNFYKSYFLNRKKSIPLIDAKIAVSKDFLTINKSKKKFITNAVSRKRVHLLRTNYNCIISTAKTINEDNSKLNCRIQGLENKSPDIFIIDRNLNLKKNSKLLQINNRKVFICTSVNNKIKINNIEKKNVKIILFKELQSKNDFLKLFKKVFNLGYNRILVESGLNFLNFLLKKNFLNTLYVFQSNKLLRKNGSNNDGIGLIKKIRLDNKIKVNLLGDKLYRCNLK